MKDTSSVDGITEKIIGCGYTISNTLGIGFLEKVYENSLAHELRKSGMNVRQQAPLSVMYDGIVVGEYVCDLLVEETVIVELKACKAIERMHSAQCINYLKATGLEVGLILNFGTPKMEVKRIVNQRQPKHAAKVSRRNRGLFDPAPSPEGVQYDDL